jgi:ammonia channel protein AmtB
MLISLTRPTSRIFWPEGSSRKASSISRKDSSHRVLYISTYVCCFHVGPSSLVSNAPHSQVRRPMIAIGAAAERAYLGPLPFFIVIWSTFVYSPIARWTWNRNGWSARLGVLDYAGGTPVHITSGATALALSFYLGIRPGIVLRGPNYRPNNVGHICLGTALIWFGWFGFNGGSALGANFQAAQALITTNVAACAGGLTFLVLVRAIPYSC